MPILAFFIIFCGIMIGVALADWKGRSWFLRIPMALAWPLFIAFIKFSDWFWSVPVSRWLVDAVSGASFFLLPLSAGFWGRVVVSNLYGASSLGCLFFLVGVAVLLWLVGPISLSVVAP